MQAQVLTGTSAGGAAVSPEGQTIAFGVETATDTFAVKLWSVASHRVTATAKAGGASGITTVAFSPDGTQLAAAGFDGTVRLWDARDTGSAPVPLANFSGNRYPIEHIAYSPDGATLASASNDGSIALWNTRGAILGGVANSSDALAFSPDGKTLAVSTGVPGQYAIALYSMPAQKRAGLLPVNGIAVLAFSPDGTLLAVSAVKDTTMEVWSTTRLTRVSAFSDTQQTAFPPQLGGGVFMQSFSPDGRLLAAVGIDGKIRVYSVPGFSPVAVFPVIDASSSLAFSPNGRELALGNSDGNVYVYSIPATYANLNQRLAFQGSVSASSKGIFSVQFLSNGSLVAGGSDGVVRFWNVPAGQFAAIPAQTLATHWGAIAVMSYSARLGLLATGSPSGTRVWETSPAQVAANICQTLKTLLRTAASGNE